MRAAEMYRSLSIALLVARKNGMPDASEDLFLNILDELWSLMSTAERADCQPHRWMEQA